MIIENLLKVLSKVSACRPLRFYFTPNATLLKNCSVALKINFKFEPAAFRKQWLPKIPQSTNSRWHIVYSEVLDAESVLKLGPFHRSRDGSFRPRPYGIDRGQRPAPGVLVVVNQYPALRPFRDGVDRRHQLRSLSSQCMGKLLCKTPHLFLRRPSLNGNVNMDSF